MSAATRRSRQWRTGGLPSRQRGIALLVAILLVALGAILAAAIAYESAMTARRGAATFAFDDSVLVAEASEALAAYGLREVLRSSSQHSFYIGQGWDKPVGPIEVVPDVMLTASLEDMQGRFNLNWLVNTDGTPNQQAISAFQQLLSNLGLEPTWAFMFVDWIDPDSIPQPTDGAEDSVYLGQQPPYLTANRYITSSTELLALPGFGHDRYMKVAPYITALPQNSALNICTASGAVLDAFTPGRQEYGVAPDQLLKNRQAAGTCFPTLQEYQQALASSKPQQQTTQQTPGRTPSGSNTVQIGTTSSYFKLTSFVTIGTTEFNLYSLLYQDGSGNVRPILRSFTPD